jgi:streptogramin lyase
MAWGAGSVWVMTLAKTVLLRIDAKTGRVVARIQVGREPAFVLHPDEFEDAVIFADGFIWVRDSVNDQIVRVSPRSNKVIDRIPSDQPWPPAVGFGSIWIPRFEAYEVDRLDEATARIVKRFPVTGPTTIAMGAGSVWVVAHRADRLLRIDPHTNSVVATLLAKESPTGLESVLYSERSVWASDGGTNTVYRIDPKTNKTVAAITVPRGTYGGELAGGSGYVWEMNDVGVWRIDPRSNHVSGYFTVPTRPDCALSLPQPGFCLADYTIGGGWLWGLSVDKQALLIRVAPDG